MTAPSSAGAAAPRHGASLVPPTLAYAVLTVVAAIVPTALAGVTPWSSDRELLDFFTQHRGVAQLQALLTIATAIPLAVLSAVVSDRINRLGLDVPGRLIALVGGCVAAAVLAVSAMVVLAMTAVTSSSGRLATLQLGQELATGLGGTAFASFTGVLIAGIAVPGLLGRLLPKPLAAYGLAVAAVGQLALLSTVTSALDALLPITRFGGVIFLVTACFTLRRR